MNFLNFSEISAEVKEQMRIDSVDFRKLMSSINSQSRKDIKLNQCHACGKKITSYCNSHSIPASFLRNIAINGKLFNQFSLIDLPLLSSETGLNKAGVFLFICRECDSKIFKDYENKDNYKEKPTQKMLAQIAMKNFLKTSSQRMFDIAFQDNLFKKHQNNLDIMTHMSHMSHMSHCDLLENLNGFKRAQKISKKNVKDEYYLFFFERLEYVVPIAFQHQVAMAIDLNGDIINNLHSTNRNEKIQLLHIAIFPMETTSIAMMFIDIKSTRYKRFIKQFKQLPKSKQLEVLNYIVFLYSEDYYLHPNINPAIFENNNLTKLAGETGVITLSSILEDITHNNLNSIYSLDKTDGIENLLIEKYKITKTD